MLDLAPSSVIAESASGRTKRKVAIVGTAPSAEHAPFKDERWEIWGVGFRGAHVTRANRWYEVHNLALDKDGEDWPPLVRAWSADADIHMLIPDDRLADLGPKIKLIPARAILAKHSARFLSSSFAWCMADALLEGVDEIGLWGVDMEYGTEYESQRAGLFHFIEVAKHAGVEVRRVVTSGIVYEPLPYPFCHDDPLAEKLRFRHTKFQDELRTRESAYAATVARQGQLQAVLDALKRVGATDEIEKTEADKALVDRAVPAMRDGIHELRGALANVEWMQNYLKP